MVLKSSKVILSAKQLVTKYKLILKNILIKKVLTAINTVLLSSCIYQMIINVVALQKDLSKFSHQQVNNVIYGFRFIFVLVAFQLGLLVSNSYLLAYCRVKTSTVHGIVNVEMSSMCKVLCFTRAARPPLQNHEHFRSGDPHWVTVPGVTL